MLIIPLTSVATQVFTVTLGSQECLITVRTRTTGLFLDLAIAGVPVVSSVLCRDRVRLVRDSYLGLIGDLAFLDTQGTDDPDWSGLGTRWLLVYFAPGEY